MTQNRHITMIHSKDTSIKVTIETETGIVVSDALARSGLAPRDGSQAYLVVDGRIVHPASIISPGTVAYIENESIIESVLIDHISFKSGKRIIGAGHLLDGTIAHVPGASRGESHWVIRHIEHTSRNGVKHAQCHSFRIDDDPYLVGDLVRAAPSPDGRNALLFDPNTGRWSKLLGISTPPNMDPDEVTEIYKGLLWTIRITSIDVDSIDGMLIPALTHNPRLKKGGKN